MPLTAKKWRKVLFLYEHSCMTHWSMILNWAVWTCILNLLNFPPPLSHRMFHSSDSKEYKVNRLQRGFNTTYFIPNFSKMKDHKMFLKKITIIKHSKMTTFLKFILLFCKTCLEITSCCKLCLVWFQNLNPWLFL